MKLSDTNLKDTRFSGTSQSEFAPMSPTGGIVHFEGLECEKLPKVNFGQFLFQYSIREMTSWAMNRLDSGEALGRGAVETGYSTR